MGGLINTLEAEVFQWYLGLGSGAVATFGGATTSNFFGLTTAQPNEAGTSPAEYASGGNYARVQLTRRPYGRAQYSPWLARERETERTEEMP